MMTDTLINILILAIGIVIGYMAFLILIKNKIVNEKSILKGQNDVLEANAIKTNEDLIKINLEREKLGEQVVLLSKDLTHARQSVEISKTEIKNLIENKVQIQKLNVEFKNIQNERNELKNENTKLKKEEETRIQTFEKRLESANTLQTSLENEKKRIQDERVNEEKLKFEALKETWGNHEKDVENHIRLVSKKNVVTYIEPNDFPHSGKKPDNTIEILNQFIIFDAKSPGSDDLNNFPKYIKIQTESLKKYTKYDDVKKDIFLVIPSNTLHVIKEFIYNIGDYNVYIISKDSIEPIILSLKKIEEYEFADKLSPEDRDNICRIIGKFAHTTKRKIQIEQFFAREFLDILQKSKTLLPREILETVIDFENAEKLNPPMEKRKKAILTKDLIDSSNQLEKEIEIREIPQIEAKITYKEKD